METNGQEDEDAYSARYSFKQRAPLTSWNDQNLCVGYQNKFELFGDEKVYRGFVDRCQGYRDNIKVIKNLGFSKSHSNINFRTTPYKIETKTKLYHEVF